MHTGRRKSYSTYLHARSRPSRDTRPKDYELGEGRNPVRCGSFIAILPIVEGGGGVGFSFLCKRMENFKFDPAQSQFHCARSGQANGIHAHPYAALPKTSDNATKRRLEIIKPKPHFTLCQICSITMCSVYYFQGGICILHPLSTSTALKSRTQIGPSGGSQKKNK